MLQTQLRNTQYAEATFQALDADGNAVGIDGELKTAVTDGAPEGTQVRVNGMAVLVIPPDGSRGQIRVKVDADGAQGEDVEIISEEIVVDVLPNNAATLGGSIAVKSKKDLPPA